MGFNHSLRGKDGSSVPLEATNNANWDNNHSPRHCGRTRRSDRRNSQLCCNVDAFIQHADDGIDVRKFNDNVGQRNHDQYVVDERNQHIDDNGNGDQQRLD